MQSISLWQPWASLVSRGIKRFETRHWSPPVKLVGQRIALHAAKRVVPASSLDPVVLDAIIKALDGKDMKTLPRGAFLCTAILANAYRVEDVPSRPGPDNTCSLHVTSLNRKRLLLTVGQDEFMFGNFAAERWLWELTHVEEFINPIEARGQQGFWESPLPDPITEVPGETSDGETEDGATGEQEESKSAATMGG